jgi:hypothetical protein
MLPVYIPSAYERISIRTICFPRDVNDLVEIHRNNDYHPSWSLQPDTKTIETFYRMFLDWSQYGAYLLSYHGTTLFLLELVPIEYTETGYFYNAVPNDYSISIKLNIDPGQTELSIQVLSATLEGIFAANPLIRRLIFPVSYSVPGSLLRTILEKTGFSILKDQPDQGSPVIYALSRPTSGRTTIAPS